MENVYFAYDEDCQVIANIIFLARYIDPKIMRILCVVSGSPWNPEYGGAMRLHGLIKEIAKFDRTAVVLVSSSPETIAAFNDQAPAGITDNYVLSATEADSATLRRDFHALLTAWKPDVLWFFGHPTIRALGRTPNVFTMYDFPDVRWRKILREAAVTTGVQRHKLIAKSLVCRIEENLFVQRANLATVCSQEEASLLGKRPNLLVVENGFDFPETSPVRGRTTKTILLMGHLFHYPNYDGLIWFAEKVWPHIKNRVPNAEVDVIGKHEGQIGVVDTEPRINVHGFVDSIDQFVENAALLAVPLRIAGGTRLKILTAWANGLPVVSTSIGAEGLGATDGEHLLIGDTGPAFADACVEALNNPSLGQHVADGGYEYGKSSFDWSVIGTRLNQTLLEWVDNVGNRPPWPQSGGS